MKELFEMKETIKTTDITKMIQYFDFANTKASLEDFAIESNNKDAELIRIMIAHELCKTLSTRRYDFSFRITTKEVVIHAKSNDNAKEHSIFRIYINRSNCLIEMNSRVALDENVKSIFVDDVRVKKADFTKKNNQTFQVRVTYLDMSYIIESIKYLLSVYAFYNENKNAAAKERAKTVETYAKLFKDCK